MVFAIVAFGAVLGSATAAQFTLTWADNSTNETGFRIERSSDGVSFAEIATVGENVVSYVDGNLPNSTAYSYRVRAYNSAGNSGYSNVASGVTPPPASNNAPTISDIANQTINAGSNTGALAFTIGDAETVAGSLVLSAGSSNTTLIPVASVVFGGSGSARTVTVTPAAGQTGSATITVTVSDGVLSTSDTFVVTVNAVNTAPTITSLSNRTINEDGTTGAIAFTVGDGQTTAGSLTVSATSSNTTLLPSAGIVFGGSGASRTVALTPAANQSGTTTVAITVSDGALTASTSFVLTVSAVNDTPTIGSIANRSISQGANTGAIGFTVSDVETTASSLTLSAASNNTVLVPVSGIVFGGTGGNRTVTVTPVASQSGVATITITVSDGALTASRSFTLTVVSTDVAPTISTQPAAMSVIAGNPASFTVTASGSPAPSYQWRRDGVAISGANGATYAIASAQTSHAGTYSVVVSNAAGSVTSVDASLTVTEAVAIVAQPLSQSIAKGTRATLTVTATGTGLNYQWYEGLSGDVTQPVSGATSAAFTTPKLNASATYWVRVTSAGQSVNSAAAAITVVDTPRTGSGSIARGNKTLLAAPVLTAGLASDGTFSVMIAQDGTLQMLAYDGAAGLVIDAGGVTLDETGLFSFSATGVGTVTGQVTGDVITGSIAGTDITFSGTIDPVDGTTRTLTGWYTGVLVNSSSDEVIVLVGPDGRAFVLAYTETQVTGGLVQIAGSGAISVTMPDGSSANLLVDGTTGRITGTMVAAGANRKVSGTRAGEVIEKRLANTSVRAQVRQGEALMVAGFVVAGSGEKRVLVRAVGPSLAEHGVTGLIADPVVTLFRHGTATPIAQNDNWSAASNAAEVATVSDAVGAFPLAGGSKDAVLLLQLPAGVYTAHVTGVGGGTGAALVEVYDADAPAGSASIPTRLSNISLRGVAGNAGDVVIAGFVVSGDAPKQVLVRAVGAELAEHGVSGLCPDPRLTLFALVNDQHVQIAANDNWCLNPTAVAAAGDLVGAFELTTGSGSAALVIWLEPGVYTAHASSAGASGVALVEVYEVQ